MKFKSYENRHRRFHLGKVKKRRKRGDEPQTYTKYMRGVTGATAYESFVPNKITVRRKNRWMIIGQEILKQTLYILLVFTVLGIAEKWGIIPEKFLNISLSKELFVLLAFALILNIVFNIKYLFYKNRHANFLLSNEGISIQKKLYKWDEIRGPEIIKKDKFIAKPFPIRIKFPYLYFEIPRENKSLKIDLKAFDYEADLIDYMIKVYKKRNAGKPIVKNDKYEEFFIRKEY